jgi:hypothetical protein
MHVPPRWSNSCAQQRLAARFFFTNFELAESRVLIMTRFSPVGAMGIAQFIGRTWADKLSLDAFDSRSALAGFGPG